MGQQKKHYTSVVSFILLCPIIRAPVPSETSKGQGAFKEGQGHQDLEVPGNSRKDQGQPVGSLKGETRELEDERIPSPILGIMNLGELGRLQVLPT